MSNPIELVEYYRTLEIQPGASLEEVERAYERQTKAWDPRQFGGNEPRRRKAEKKLRQLNRAYEKLREELGGGVATATAESAPAAASEPEAAAAPKRHWTAYWRWLWIVAMLLALTYLGYDSYIRFLGIAHTSDTGMTNYPLPEKDPTSRTGYPGDQHRLILPALGTDGQHWTMQTERMLDGREGLRVRHVDYDGVAPESQVNGGGVSMSSSQAEKLISGADSGQQNASVAHLNDDTSTTGREVHWSSSLHWLAAGLAWVEHIYYHEPIAYSLENTVQWANTFALALVMIFVPIAVVRRMGSIATAILVVCFIAIYPYYEFSYVGYFDHHGLVASCDLMMVLFLAAAGAGWLRNEGVDVATLGPVEAALWKWLPDRRQAKRWMIASGIIVGAGLWVSTASVIPALVGVGLAGLLSTGWLARKTTANFEKGVRAWAPWLVGGLALAGAVAAGLKFGLLGAVLGGVGLAIFGAFVFYGLANNPLEKNPLGIADPTLWRVWGAAAACSSVFFYLLEYAPAHFTMRLEVNHPLYALALLGAGDLMCRLSWFISGQPGPQTGFWRRQWAIALGDLAIFGVMAFLVVLLQQKLIQVLPLLALFVMLLLGVAGYWAARNFGWIKFDQAADDHEAFWRKQWLGSLLSLAVVGLLPVTILLFGESVFVIRSGGFLLNLHIDYILEFRTFLRQMLTLSPIQVVGGISVIPLAVIPIGLLLFATELQRTWKAVLLMALLPAFVMLGLAMWQIRWLGISCAMWSAGLAVSALVTTSPGSAYRWREGFRRPLAAVLLIAVLVPWPLFTAIGWLTNRDSIGDYDLTQILTRDVSERLRARLGDETGVILSGPTTTTWMMYFGGFHGIGSLYWENVDGLETAGKIYSAGPTWDDAKELIDKYHITHIAIFSWDPFALEYARLGAGYRLPKTVNEAIAQNKTLKDSFIIKLWYQRDMQPPNWLRFIPYQVPNSPLLKGYDIMLLEVVPPQSTEDTLDHWAEYLLTKSNPQSQDQAAKIFDTVLQNKPNYLPALLDRANLERTRAQNAVTAGNGQQALELDTAFKADMEQILANLDQAKDPHFALDDRVNLAQVLYDSNHLPESYAQLQVAFDTATEHDLRRLTMERLQLLLLMQAHMPADLAVSQKNLNLAMSLLPKPVQATIFGERGDMMAQKDLGKAIDLYKQALALNPDLDHALTSLARILVIAGDPKLRDGKKAIELANQAAKDSHQQTAENLEILAYGSAEIGNFDDAVFYGRMALMMLENANTKDSLVAADDWRARVQAFANHQVDVPQPAAPK